MATVLSVLTWIVKFGLQLLALPLPAIATAVSRVMFWDRHVRDGVSIEIARQPETPQPLLVSRSDSGWGLRLVFEVDVRHPYLDMQIESIEFSLERPVLRFTYPAWSEKAAGRHSCLTALTHEQGEWLKAQASKPITVQGLACLRWFGRRIVKRFEMVATIHASS
jgi:hypothetical protein